MRLEERKVAVRDLEVGMYVCRLDRDWTETPYPLQGIAIASQDDIDGLARYCDEVYVDIELGLAPRAERMQALPPRRTVPTEDIPKLQGSVAYANTSTFDDEVPRANEALAAARELAIRVLDDLRNGRAISPDQVRSAVEPVVRSILRNDDAFFWIESLRKRDAYEYHHALNCSALAAAYGRHIGFPEELLADLASGGLLLDVGKVRVPADVLSRSGPLDPASLAQVRRHVQHGLDIVQEHQLVPGHVADMIRAHHEREDGSGYPDRLHGEGIPLLARIAGVIDSYDAMTSERPHRKAMARHQALQVLYAERDRLYAAEVVEQFLQCLGVYPTGSLVELTSGEVAAVMAQSPTRRLRPRVMVLTTPDKQLLPDFQPVDLMMMDSDLQVLRTVEPGSYGIDPAELFL